MFKHVFSDTNNCLNMYPLFWLMVFGVGQFTTYTCSWACVQYASGALEKGIGPGRLVCITRQTFHLALATN
jgi:hypothetical protein